MRDRQTEESGDDQTYRLNGWCASLVSGLKTLYHGPTATGCVFLVYVSPWSEIQPVRGSPGDTGWSHAEKATGCSIMVRKRSQQCSYQRWKKKGYLCSVMAYRTTLHILTSNVGEEKNTWYLLLELFYFLFFSNTIKAKRVYDKECMVWIPICD